MNSTPIRDIPSKHLETDIGKVVARDAYFHVSLLERLPEAMQVSVEVGISLTRLTAGSDFNVTYPVRGGIGLVRRSPHLKCINIGLSMMLNSRGSLGYDRAPHYVLPCC